MRRRLAALLLTTLAYAPVAAAQSAPAAPAAAEGGAAANDADLQNRRAAAEAYDTGTARYLRRDFANAANWFETADRLAPSPAALQSAIRAHRDAGTPEHLARAATLSLRLLSRYPGDARLEAAAQRILQQISPQFARLNVRCGSCEIEVDQVLQSSTEFFVPPGQHTLVAHWSENRTLQREVEAVAGSVETITLEEPARAGGSSTPGGGGEGNPEDPDERPRSSTGLRVVPIPVFVVGALVTSALFAGGAINWFAHTVPSADNLLFQAESTQRRDPRLEQEVANSETATTALLISGGVAGAATAVLGIIFTRWTPPPRQPRVTALPGPSGTIGLTIDGRF